MTHTPLLARRRVLGAAAATTGLAVAGFPALAQNAWPAKPIRFVVPFAPGGTSEIVARSVAAELTKQLGQSVFVENKPGGAGVTAMQEVAKAAPDGHTLILTHVGTLAVNPYMLKNQPYDVSRDFAPVTLLAKVPNVFVIHPDVPARNFQEFVAYAKKNPGQLNYGSAGNASAGHLAMEYLKLVTGMFITHIPYRGTGPQLTDLLAGRLDAASVGAAAILPQIKAGKLRPLVITSARRSAQLPEVPTLEESGIKEANVQSWQAVAGPRGLPADVKAKVQGAIAAAVADPAIKARLLDLGFEIVANTPEQFAAFQAAEYARWQKLITARNIKAD